MEAAADWPRKDNDHPGLERPGRTLRDLGTQLRLNAGERDHQVADVLRDLGHAAPLHVGHEGSGVGVQLEQVELARIFVRDENLELKCSRLVAQGALAVGEDGSQHFIPGAGFDFDGSDDGVLHSLTPGSGLWPRLDEETWRTSASAKRPSRGLRAACFVRPDVRGNLTAAAGAVSPDRDDSTAGPGLACSACRRGSG